MILVRTKNEKNNSSALLLCIVQITKCNLLNDQFCDVVFVIYCFLWYDK